MDLANLVVKTIEENPSKEMKFAYEDEDDVKTKVSKVANNLYGANLVTFSPTAKKKLTMIEELGYTRFPICIAKTQYSFSDDPTKLGAPEGFTVSVKNVKISAGAGFVVVLTGDIMTMPGLPKEPAAEKIDVDSNGKISGLF